GAFSNRRDRITRLWIAFGRGESSVYRDVHVVPFLFTECISKMAGEIARAATVDGVGACHHEPGVRAGWQSLLERSGLHVWRGIPSSRGRRPNEKNATLRCKADGRLQHRSARRID